MAATLKEARQAFGYIAAVDGGKGLPARARSSRAAGAETETGGGGGDGRRELALARWAPGAPLALEGGSPSCSSSSRVLSLLGGWV